MYNKNWNLEIKNGKIICETNFEVGETPFSSGKVSYEPIINEREITKRYTFNGLKDFIDKASLEDYLEEDELENEWNGLTDKEINEQLNRLYELGARPDDKALLDFIFNFGEEDEWW